MSVIEFRVAVTTEDFNRAVAFYRDGLGLVAGDIWDDGGKGQVFTAGRATLEIFDEAQAEIVDQLEVGSRVSGEIRFAFEVPDIKDAVKNAVAYGATLVHEPVMTPWNDLNARVTSPDGLQITLYQVMGKKA
jgi:catechol 2,3-dioxygenase-like lactoylglutathione lyase family enzyme